MSKMKISFAAIAFVLATAGAFATKASSTNDAPCTTSNPKTSGECPGQNLVPCCILNGQQFQKQS